MFHRKTKFVNKEKAIKEIEEITIKKRGRTITDLKRLGEILSLPELTTGSEFWLKSRKQNEKGHLLGAGPNLFPTRPRCEVSIWGTTYTIELVEGTTTGAQGNTEEPLPITDFGFKRGGIMQIDADRHDRWVFLLLHKHTERWDGMPSYITHPGVENGTPRKWYWKDVETETNELYEIEDFREFATTTVTNTLKESQNKVRELAKAMRDKFSMTSLNHEAPSARDVSRDIKIVLKSAERKVLDFVIEFCLGITGEMMTKIQEAIESDILTHDKAHSVWNINGKQFLRYGVDKNADIALIEYIYDKGFNTLKDALENNEGKPTSDKLPTEKGLKPQGKEQNPLPPQRS